jgi:hypothetical protein
MTHNECHSTKWQLSIMMLDQNGSLEGWQTAVQCDT